MNSRIRELRKLAGLTQADFAEKLRLSQNYIAQIETGKRSPSDRTIDDICRAFGVSKEWLKTGVGDMFQKDDEDDAMEAFGKLAARRDPIIDSFVGFLRSRTPGQLEEIAQIIEDCAEFLKQRK